MHEQVRGEGLAERKLLHLFRRGLIVQLGRPVPRVRPRAWRLGPDWVRDFLDARR